MQPDPVENNNTNPQQPTEIPNPSPEQPAVINEANTGVPNQPVSFGGDAPVGKKRKIPTVVLLVGIALLLVGGGAAAYFSTVVANKPENIWAKALDNTNKGYEKIIDYMQEHKETKDYDLTGEFKIDAPEAVVDGNVKGKINDKSGDLTLDVGAAGTRVNINALFNVPDNSEFPDVYIRATGLQGISQMLGGSASEAGSMLAAFENQWYAVDHTLFEQLEKQSGASSTQNLPDLTSDDLIAIMEAIGRVNSEYLFTDEQDKAVLNVKEKIGEETLEGRKVYHFKVGYNKENLKKYATALKDELNKTKVKELVPEQNLEKAMDLEGMLKEIDKLDGNDTADAWVDLETKLIRKVRFIEKDKPENYVDLVFNYDGGDEYPFLIVVHNKDELTEMNANFGVKLNTKQDTVEYTVDANVTGQDPFALKVTLKLSPSKEKFEFKKPEGAKSLSDLLGGLLGGQIPMTAPGGSMMPGEFDGLQL